MSIYTYKALDRYGKVIRGKIAAENEVDLESKLKQSELDLLESKPVGKFALSNLFSGIDVKEIILICIHFHYLEKAGVPILEAIGELRDTASNPRVKEIMMDVYDSVKNGKLLSEALAQYPSTFDNIFINLLKAGERTGNLAEIFEHLENHYKWVLELTEKLKKATTYPIVLLLLLCVVMGVMMVVVIPKLTEFLVSQNIPLPLYTKALIIFSNFIVKFWPLIIMSPLIFYFGVKFGKKLSPKFHLIFDRFVLMFPIIGSIVKKIEIARFCHFFSITYQSGISILECLEVSSDTVNNLIIKNAILKAKDEVSDGKSLTNAIESSKEFPAIVIRMFKVGENSGKLDESLHNINVFYDSEIKSSIDKLVELLQPALTVIMGGLLLWVSAAVFGPIYSSFSTRKM